MLVTTIKGYQRMFGYILLAVPVGLLVGAFDAVFGIVLLELTNFRSLHWNVLVPVLPLAGICVMLLYRKLSKESLRGMTLVFEAGHGSRERIPKMLIPLVMVSTWITHLFGGSAGREGVAVQIGATIAHTFGRKMKLPDNSRILLVVGMAAGFAGLFQTPLAATFFALEVLVAGSLFYDALLPAMTAAFIASTTSHFLGLEKFSVPINETILFTPTMIAKLVVIGILFGVVGGSFAHLLAFAKKFFADRLSDPVKRIFIMGCGLSVLLFILYAGRYCGLGTNLIDEALSGKQMFAYDWILKFVLTILTLSAGYQGGEVTPLFAIGASLGAALACLLGIPPILAAALGYAAVFGSATNTLLSPILIGVEVFGAEYTPVFAIVCAIAYTFNGNRTIYSSQKKLSYFDAN